MSSETITLADIEAARAATKGPQNYYLIVPKPWILQVFELGTEEQFQKFLEKNPHMQESERDMVTITC